MSLFSQKKPLRMVTVFNVGSGQVRAAVARVEQGAVPLVMYSTASYVPFFDLDDKERYERAMLATLLEVAMLLSTEYLSTLTWSARRKIEFICVLSSPWFVEATRSVTLKKKSPFVVTRPLVLNLQEKERQGFVESLAVGRGRHAATTEVESLLLATQLDGYPTKNIYDRAVHEMRCTFHLSEVTNTLQKRIKETLSQLTGHAPIHFATSTLVAHHALQKIFPQEKEYLQVLVSGECTDISIVEKGVLLATQTFPHGTRSLLRNMAQKHGMNFEEAVGRARLYLSDKQALRNDAAYASFQKGFDAWLTLFNKTAHMITLGTPLSGKAIVIAEELWQQAYATKLGTIALTELTLRKEPITVTPLTKAVCDEHTCIKLAPNIAFNTHIVVDIVGLS